MLLIPSIVSAEKFIPKYLWNLGFAIASDCTPFGNGLPPEYETFPSPPYLNPVHYINDIRDGDVVWVQSAQLVNFIKNVFPSLRAKIVLVVNDGDESFPSDQARHVNMNEFLSDARILHVFAQNIDGTINSNKVSALPIGIDFHSIARSSGYFGEPHMSLERQEEILDELLSSLRPTSERKKRALIEFQFSDRPIYGGETRGQVASKIMPGGVIDKLNHRLPRGELWRRKGEYAFSISPHGNGLDCHRTWEDLVLGCIVIVKTSPLDSMYEGLPVVIVKDWSEVNAANFDKWLAQYGDAFTNPQYRERLSHQYWMNKIHNMGGK